jgi:Zn-dependent peptidase ImmA (M78 family)
MEAWMHDVQHAVLATQRQLRHDVPDLEGRFRRLTEALCDEVASVRAEQSAGGAVPELA